LKAPKKALKEKREADANRLQSPHATLHPDQHGEDDELDLEDNLPQRHIRADGRRTEEGDHPGEGHRTAEVDSPLGQ